MTEHPHHLDRETAEHLLSGRSATAHPELSGLLASAAAPAQELELSGESAAMAAFQAAQQTRGARSHRLRRLLILKISAIAALVTAGGLAFASGTGILPSPFSPAPQMPPASPSQTGSPSVTPSPADSTQADSLSGVGGLCKAYGAKTDEDRGKALKSTAFERLVTAAGGPDLVEAYCASLTDKEKAEKPHSPASDTSHKAKPTTPAPPSKAGRNTNPRRGAVGGELPSPSDKDSICSNPGSPAC